ncbi:MAG TPA: cellulase family glycosylhydrolase [Paludibacteraceae bacterium]|nr:cellulase family glycosylhydrolase [Paludibacteraceae bacterium]HPH63377.1 cellulase family glycosylhydrolase [Paludibacteraceae bacterium]
MSKNYLLKKCALGFCALMSTFVASAGSYPEGSPVALNGKLRVEGTQMVNECGTPVQLRGMSTHGLAWYPQCYTDESIKNLVEEWNISIFRLAVYTHEWGGYTTNQWKSADEYHQYIDELVDICGKYGIYCIIDWHILNKGSGDPNYTLDYAKPFWDYMSNKYKDDKHVLYEICNEPNGNVDWAKVKKYADIVVPIIRNNDPKTIVICGTPTWSQRVDWAAQDPLSYDNIMYTLHFYSGTHFDDVRGCGQTAIDKGLALFVTEFGTSLSSGNGGPYLDECDVWMDWMKERKISWCNWSYAAKDEVSAALEVGSCDSKDWDNVTESGEYIKGKLAEPNNFTACLNSVEENSYNDLVSIYPNPARDQFTINMPENTEVESLKIVDMMGRVVYTFDGSINNVDISDLNEGIYFVHIYISDGVAIKRIVKE